MGAVAVLVSRLIDLAAALSQLSFKPSASDQLRFRNLASTIASIRNDLISRRIPGPVQFNRDEESELFAQWTESDLLSLDFGEG